jgi:hypothetical protein
MISYLGQLYIKEASKHIFPVLETDDDFDEQINKALEVLSE